MRALPKNFQPSRLPLVLRFGDRSCVLRRLRKDDAERLLAFFATHTPETIRQRYGFQLAHMTPERAVELASVNQRRHCALGIFQRTGRETRLLAVGRYSLGTDRQTAEMAFVVHEQCRRLGMATVLLEVLIAIARHRKLLRLVAQTQSDNYAMLRIFLRHGARLQEVAGTESMDVTLAI